MTQTPAEAFWHFSTTVYAAPGVERACLAIQADGLDVNLALFALWALHIGKDPEPAFDLAIERSLSWRTQIVQPLRDARNALKPVPDFVDASEAKALRQTILSVELEAERVQQSTLAPLLDGCPDTDAPISSDTALTKLETLAKAAGADQEIQQTLRQFVTSVFPALENV